MDILIEVFINFPLSILNTEFEIFSYTVSLKQIFIFGILASIGALIIRKLFGG